MTMPWHHDDKEDDGDEGGECVTSEVLTIRSDTINRRRRIPNCIAPLVLYCTIILQSWHHDTMTPWYHDTVILWHRDTMIPWHHEKPRYHDTINRRHGIRPLGTTVKAQLRSSDIPIAIVCKICWQWIHKVQKVSYASVCTRCMWSLGFW